MDSLNKPIYLVRKTNKELREREHLTPTEVNSLIKAARRYNRYGLRDATMIMLCYRHGLRLSELVTLRWAQIDLKAGTLFINRLKGSVSNTHPLHGPELRHLKQLKLKNEQNSYVFINERKAPISGDAFRVMLKRTNANAKLDIKVHPHMLRHACGYKLANDGTDIRVIQSYLGHKDIHHTVRYTELAPNKFKDLWVD